VTLDLQGNIKSGFFTMSSGAPKRYGFHLNGVREWPNLLSTNHHVHFTTEHYHIVDRYLKIAAAAFPGGDHKTEARLLEPHNGSVAEVESRLQKSGIYGMKRVLFHPGTTWQTKWWSMELWRELALLLLRNPNTGLVLSWGDEKERFFVESIAKGAQKRAVIWPRGSLRDLVALLSRMDVVVGGDTGPVHIAAALGTPTVSLYRGSGADRSAPRGENHASIQSPLPCSPCFLRQCPRDEACIKSIRVEDVLQAIETLSSRSAH
jgi:heptosyltransferase-1